MILAFIFAAVLAQTPARDARPHADEAALSGRVLDRATGAPLRNARVSITAEDGTGPDPVLTDTRGRYRFSSLTPGRYTLSASKPGYVSTRFGARGALDPPVVLTIEAAPQAVDVRLERSAAISGHVVDDIGAPLTGVSVSVGEVVRRGGRTQFVPVRSAQSDDLGEYRVYGLPAGRYFVSARPVPDLPQFTGFTFIVPGSDADGLTYQRLFYPSTPSLAQARALPVKAGDEITGIDLTFRQMHAPKLTVTAIDGSGQPVDAFFTVSTDSVELGRLAHSGRISAGRPTTIDVDPGDVTLMIASGTAWFLQSLTIGETDLQVTAVLTPGLTLSGRIVFDGGRPAISGPIGLRDVPNGVPLLGAAGPPAMMAPDGTFRVTGVRNVADVQVFNAPRGWRLKAIMWHGRNLLDAPPDRGVTTLPDVEVVLTNVHSEIDGSLVDASGQPVADANVLIVPQDAALLAKPDRWARWVRADRDGHFTAADLPAGRYVAIALADVDETQWSTPDYLAPLRARGVVFSLADGERRALAVPFTAGAGK